MDTYNKSVQHNWFHHATWGDSKYKSEGIGEVLWHSLTESGKVEFVNIKFGNKTYENVDVKHLKPVEIQEHQHKRTGKELDDKKKTKKESAMNFVKQMVKEEIKNIIAENKEVAIVEKFNLFLEKNVPTDASKWSYYKSQAKKKFDVYPSAYANGWAAKQYKAAGGGWKKG